MRGKKAEPLPKTKAELARELSDRAKALVSSLDRDPLELAAIAVELQQDRELLAELGFGSLLEWGKATFGKKWKSIQNWANVYQKLFVDAGYSKDDILEIGTVKANLLARLPESEVRKAEWSTAAKELSTADFKQKVKGFLDESPDHREGFCKITFDAPKSFRDETWKPTIAKGLAAEGTEDVHVVVEAMTANYLIELQNGEATDAAIATETSTGKDAAPRTEHGDNCSGYECDGLAKAIPDTGKAGEAAAPFGADAETAGGTDYQS